MRFLQLWMTLCVTRKGCHLLVNFLLSVRERSRWAVELLFSLCQLWIILLSRSVTQIRQRELGSFAASTTSCSPQVLQWSMRLQVLWLHSPVHPQQSRYESDVFSSSVASSALKWMLCAVCWYLGVKALVKWAVPHFSYDTSHCPKVSLPTGHKKKTWS